MYECETMCKLEDRMKEFVSHRNEKIKGFIEFVFGKGSWSFFSIVATWREKGKQSIRDKNRWNGNYSESSSSRNKMK